MTSALPRITDDERRARLGIRHRLAAGARAANAEDAARAVLLLHATDPATVYVSACARLAEPSSAEVERALYDDRSLVRMPGMRRTVYVVPRELVHVVQRSSTDAVAITQRRVMLQFLASGGYDEAWLDEVEAATVAALAELGEATAVQLGEVVPQLRTQIRVAIGKPYEANQGVSTRLLFTLSCEGRIVRTRPQGSWLSSRFRYTIAPPLPEIGRTEAKAELVRGWLAAFGPGTPADLKWWTGWTAADTRHALAAVRAVEVALDDGSVGYVLPGDEAPSPTPEPWAALLPALDATPMAWKGRDWYITPELRERLFDRMGNIGPTVWWNGRVVGGWATRADGEVVWQALVDLPPEATKAIEAEAARHASWLAGTCVTPRFRVPLERELSG
ncbi:winged helix DNA-binding domain-containing protein [Embleya scabrispora]|uniref:winged helix DNA-binding domain-containing protein n=1 Tax=Embleya scabrispora TaxID=159449 RepID=UPI00037E915E|nr:winged helix DNA-binding domain-containing protein [Embleya scabrispora]MYS80984.1 winged helix DNA-binding domain-containing protein [Streptomyces sp. SID5474]